MGRLHLIEFHEQPWCPAPIRDAATDYLQFAANVGSQYANLVPRIRRAVERSGARRVVDLCSGGGGPWLSLQPALAEDGGDVPVVLTDRFPNADAMARASRQTGGALVGRPEPVDAMAVPDELDGFRTMFASFHHFRPGEARGILADAVARRQGIGVFEPIPREALSFVGLLLAPLIALFVTPFIRPFRWSRLLWTYLIPVVPLLIVFDGFVSALRTYSPDELQALVDGLDAPDYEWEIGREKNPAAPIELTYLIGTPTAVAA